MRERAEDVLGDILFDMWSIDMRDDTELRKEKLLGNRIKMAARDLLVLLYEIEARMNIHLDKDSIINGNFDTFDHIVELICNALS